jgi:hypothetical protein
MPSEQGRQFLNNRKGTPLMRRQLNKQLAEQAWAMYQQSVPQHVIAQELKVHSTTVCKWIAKKQDAHPAANWNQERMNVDSFLGFQSAALTIRQEIAGYRRRGEPVPAPLLSMLSTHADRFARWATRQSAVPVVEVNAGSCFDSPLWAGLLGAASQAPLADASAVDCAQIEPAQASESQPDVRVPADVTGTQALIPGLDC